MKTQNLLLTILIAIFIMSCSSDDSQPNEEEEEETNIELKLYKKTNSYNDGILTSSQEIFYNSDNKIESVTLNEVDY